MWNTLENAIGLKWASAKTDEAQHIVRLACNFAPAMGFKPDSGKVQLIPMSAVGYSLVFVTDGSKELYGFCSLTDFHPLDVEGKAFELLYFLLYADRVHEVEDRLNRIKDSFLEYAKIHADIIQSPTRINAFVPLPDWNYLADEKGLYSTLDLALPATGKVYSVWYCKPAFTTGHRLLEIIYYTHTGTLEFSRCYVWADEKNKDFVSIDGSSSPTFTVWAKGGFAPLDNNTLENYLRYFCWSIESSEGIFVLPLSLSDVPWSAAPGREKWGDLYRLLSNTQLTAEKSEKSGFEKRQGTVIYGDNIFTAVFEVKMAAGEVSMADDEPLKVICPFVLRSLEANTYRFLRRKVQK